MNYTTKREDIYRYEISKAFDNDYDTYWRVNYLKENELTYPTNIVITFANTISIGKMLYQAPKINNIEGYGYPTELRIYVKFRNIDGTLSDDESDFLLFDDIISEKTGNIVLFTFNEEIRCDQLKLEWTRLEDSDIPIYASAKEITLLFPDNKYFDELIGAFMPNDYTYLLLKPEYNNIDIIDTLVDKIKEYYEISSSIQGMITRIMRIIRGDIKFEEKREFTTNPNAVLNIIHQYGDIQYYSNHILRMKRGFINRQSTGIYGLSNQTIKIYVDADDEEKNLPSIRFSQFLGEPGMISNPYKLKKGINNLIFNNYNTQDYYKKVNGGGPIYIENKFTSEEQSQNIRVYIYGGILFPLFRLNDDEEEYKFQLSEFILHSDPHSKQYLNITELESDHIQITISATDAYENYLIKNKSPQKNLLYWDKVMKQYLIFDGIQFESIQPYYDYKNNFLKINIRQSQYYRGARAYASKEHIGIYDPDHRYILLVSYEGIYEDFAHEIGHMIDVDPREITEDTNNVLREFSLRVIDKNDRYNFFFEVFEMKMLLDNINPLLRGCDSKDQSQCNGLFLRYNKYNMNYLLWWNIESLYPGYWGKLNNLYRYNTSMISGMPFKSEWLIYYSNYITGLDLGYYFERYGFTFPPREPFNNSDTSIIYQEKMKELIENGTINPLIKKKFWYIDGDEYNYMLEFGTGCYKNNNNYNLEIGNIFINDTTGYYNISLPRISCKGHLGFEIYDNNTIIGFSHKSYYIDTQQYNEGYLPNYTIIAYDRLLDYSKPSPSKMVKEKKNISKMNIPYFTFPFLQKNFVQKRG